MMKKWIKIVGILVVVALGIVALAGVVSAQGPGGRGNKDRTSCSQQVGDGLRQGWRFSEDDEELGLGRRQLEGGERLSDCGEDCAACGQQSDSGPSRAGHPAATMRNRGKVGDGGEMANVAPFQWRRDCDEGCTACDQEKSNGSMQERGRSGSGRQGGFGSQR